MADSEHSKALERALRLLAGREHSRRELQRKLQTRGFAAQVVVAVLDELEAENLQSDQRYAEAFIRDRIRRGHGPLRILRDLQQRGVAASIGQRQLEAEDTDWESSARRVRSKRFGDTAPENIRQRSRQVRFLEYRGFTAEQIRASFQSWDI